MARRLRSSEAGFSLIEAIVAIAVLTAALIPLYLLLGNVTDGARRLDQNYRRAEIEIDALNLLAVVNPMQQPTGTVDLGPYALRWKAQPEADPIDGSAYPRGRSAFRIGLYDTDAEVADPSGRVLVKFSLRMIGYQNVANDAPSQR